MQTTTNKDAMGSLNVNISIVLAAYNAEMFLKEAIDSILAQTFSDFELIIINDGSSDTTADIILNYTDSRIVYLDNEINKGLIYSLNRGLSACKGKYIARMDADDIALPHRLQVQFDYMEAHPEIGICGSLIETFYDSGKKKIIRFPETDSAVRAYTYFQAAFCHPTVMMRKAVLVENQLDYSTGFLHTEDYALWIKILKYTKACNIQSVLLRYRKHEGSVTWLSGKKPKPVSNASLIQGIYLKANGIDLADADLPLFSCLVNRSKGCPLDSSSQQALDRIFRSFFTQLYGKQKDLAPIAMEYVSSACFYHFVKNRKFPATSYLRKLYVQGIFTFIKRAPVYLKRMVFGK
jgi:glycosyltransferase involved in cell wall biosynthesis